MVSVGDLCAAFPDGIPREIFFGGSHSEHVEGDNGIKYEPVEDLGAEEKGTDE